MSDHYLPWPSLDTLKSGELYANDIRSGYMSMNNVIAEVNKKNIHTCVTNWGCVRVWGANITQQWTNTIREDII